MVANPLVCYLLGLDGYEVTVADMEVFKAECMVGDCSNGKSLTLDATDPEQIEELVKSSDITVSLLPYSFHPTVAKACIKHGKHMVTTSYISDAMKELDEAAKEANLLILNECGLDPGIDHMSAMKVIANAEAAGGKVTSFRSTTGALPAHEANNNPFGYKFSWSPKGVLLASRNAAKYLEDGKVVDIPGEQLFENYFIQDVPGVGAFENYPNRNSLPYMELYGLNDAQTVYRGTFRFTGWCETMRKVVALGWLREEALEGFQGETFADVTRYLIGAPVDMDLDVAVAEHLEIEIYSTVLHRLKWLGLLSEEPLPEGKDNPIDWLNVLSLSKMELPKGEKDMVVMHHEFIVEYPDKPTQRITSTLLDHGVPGEDTSIARTVSLPAAMAVKMIVNGRVKARGVHIPNIANIYEPILEELEGLGIKFTERTTPL